MKERIINLYVSGMTMKEVAIATGKSVGFIQKIVKEQGVQKTRGGKPYPNVDKMYSFYQTGVSLREVGRKFGYGSENSVSKIFAKHHLPIRTKAGVGDTLNHHYFSKINSEGKAYILGLLLADGNVTERKSSQAAIKIELKKKDLPTLEFIKKEFQTRNRITQSRGCYRLAVHSNVMAADLCRYSVFPNKTGMKFLPIKEIPLELHSHFLRGFFDGNGWITNTHHTLRGTKYPSTAIGFADGYGILAELRDYLEERLGAYHVKVCESKGCFLIAYSSKKDVSVIKEFLYKDSTIYMQRKYDKCFGNTERG